MRHNELYVKPLIKCCLERRKGVSQVTSITTRTAQKELIRTGMSPQGKSWLYVGSREMAKFRVVLDLGIGVKDSLTM